MIDSRSAGTPPSVARAIANLGGAESIAAEHVCEAIHYRRLDRQL